MPAEKFRENIVLAFVFFLAVFALGGAFIVEYGFGYKPCILCLYQRIPYAIIIVLSLIALRLPLWWQHKIVWLCITLFVVEAGLAIHHVGVEQQWWQFVGGCQGGVADSLEDLRSQIFGNIAPPCDEPALVILGLSMAGWNVVYALLAALVVWRVEKQ